MKKKIIIVSLAVFILIIFNTGRSSKDQNNIALCKEMVFERSSKIAKSKDVVVGRNDDIYLFSTYGSKSGRTFGYTCSVGEQFTEVSHFNSYEDLEDGSFNYKVTRTDTYRNSDFNNRL